INFTPTAENIEDLPEPLRKYIMELKEALRKTVTERHKIEVVIEEEEVLLDELVSIPPPPKCSCPAFVTCPECIFSKLHHGA
ncbi:MAG: hypothetical protein DRP42_05355, partial [Tenericutes bacterium]